MFAIFKRELKTYFLTPTGYIFMSFFLLLAGIFFAYGNLFTRSPRLSGLMGNILFTFLLIVPILTMRLMTDELRQKTDQLLLTTPIRITDIVLGKYFAAVVLFIMSLTVTLLYVLVTSFYGEIDILETFGSYIGFLLMGTAFISVGLFVSTTTENQVIAAIVTFVALLIAWIMDMVKEVVPSSDLSGIIFVALLLVGVCFWIYTSLRSWIITGATAAVGIGVILLLFFLQRGVYYNLIGNVLEWFSLLDRYQSFSIGLIKLKDVVYYLTFSSFFVFLTIRLIEKRRWSY